MFIARFLITMLRHGWMSIRQGARIDHTVFT